MVPHTYEQMLNKFAWYHLWNETHDLKQDEIELLAEELYDICITLVRDESTFN
tara:strand:- start:8314 stop:8472 length:159 start_codon:yes stop_codon:yes gene_type:complete